MATKMIKVEMLADYADWDDIFSLELVFHMLNRLDIPENTMTDIHRIRNLHDNKQFVGYKHTYLKNK